MLTYYNDNDDGFHKDAKIPDDKKVLSFEVVNPYPGQRVSIKYYCVNNYMDDEVIKEEVLSGDMLKYDVEVSLFDLCYIEISPAI